MPIYEYTCTKCGKDFEELVFGDDLPGCAHCSGGNGGDDSFAPSMPASSGGCAGCSGGNCATCGH